MSVGELAFKSIKNGNASRYIKPRWLKMGELSTEAFDLREGTPPETYVSHFIAEGLSLSEIFKSAYLNISAKIEQCNKGSIAILDIHEALAEVNDEAKPLIDFIEKDLPHCGLVYVTISQQQIQEAKATLCLLAGKRLTSAKTIHDGIANTKQIK